MIRPGVTLPVIDNRLLKSQTLGGHSLNTLWEKAYLCPCRNPRTNQPDQNCTRCNGTGMAYMPPVELKCIITSQAKGVRNGDIGFTDSGLAYGTPDSKESSINGGISFRDRITIPDVKISQSFIFNVIQDRVDKGMFLYYDVHSIDYITTLNHGELTQDTDYTFDSDKNRIYPKSHLIGDNISVNIGVTLRYLVVDLLKESRYEYKTVNGKNTFIPLPKKLLLRREDAFYSSESFSQGTGDIDNFVDPKRPALLDPSGIETFFKK